MLMDQDYSVHFHVWDQPAMLYMVMNFNDKFGVRTDIEAMLKSGDEVILILRKK